MTRTATASAVRSPEVAASGPEVPDAQQSRVLAAVAELLSYPSARSEAAAELLASAGLLRDAAIGARLRRSRAELEEQYTRTFDLDPACPPYVGHHLFGEETGRRGPFLARLLEIYGRDGFAPREELADHVAEVLRFLAVARPGAERDDLVRDGLLPTLRKMTEQLDDETHPYRDVLATACRVVATTGGVDAGCGP